MQRATSNWPEKILSVAAAIVLYLAYRIGTLEERYFSVPLEIVSAESFVTVGDADESVRIGLRGQPDDIFLVLEDDVEAYVDLTSFGEGQFRAPVLVRKTGTAQDLEIEISVEPLEITMTQEAVLTRRVDIYPSVVGEPLSGFELVDYSISPLLVELKGSRSVVESIQGVATEEVVLDGRAEDFSVSIPISLPDPSIEIVGREIVDFTGIVRPIVIAERYRSLPIEADGLPPGYVATFSASSADIRVRGESLVLELLAPDSFRLTIDLSEVDSIGVFDLDLIAELPAETELLGIIPERIGVTISRANAVLDGDGL